MKKRLTLLSLLLLFTMTAMAKTLVEGIYVDSIYYYLLNNGSIKTAEVAKKPDGTKYSGDIVIPASISVGGVDYTVTRINVAVFSDCSGLTSIEIPNSVTEIGGRAFAYCSGLTSIEIPNSVTEIEGSAFNYCSGLTSIEIPNSVTSIGSYAFRGCSSLTSIVVEEGNSYYDSRENCNAIIKTSSNTLVAGCQNTVIPNSVTSIGYAAFCGCSSLTSIKIPNSVTSIEDDAFVYCSGLTSIEIPNSVTSIGVSAFAYSGLTSIEIPNSVTEIGGSAFYGCSGLTSIEIPNSVTSIGDGAFYNCDALTSIEIPNSVTAIGGRAFRGCSGLTSIEIPYSVTSIEDDAFFDCSGLTSITMQRATPPTVGENLFFGCSKLDSIYVPIGAAEAYNVAPWNEYNIVERELGTPNAVLKLTFDRTGDNVSVNVAGLEGVTASVVSKSHAWKDLSVTNANTILCPNVNGNTDPTITWGILLNGVPANYKLQGMALDIHALNSSGNYQYPKDYVNRHWNVAVAQGETLLANFADIEISQGGDGRIGNNHKVHSVAAVEALAATDPMTLNFTITKGSENAGCFFGLSEVNLTYKVADYVYLTDGEAYTNATEKETEGIVYTREFKNTQWQSWYVPFDMDYNDISDEYTAACLNDIHEYDDDEDGVLDRWTMEVLILRPGETIYANLPYVIRAKAVGEKQFVVENTMLYPADEQSMDCSSMRMHYTFTGTYSPIEAQVLRDNGWLAMGNGRLVTPTTTSTLKANRWYLESTPRKGYGSTYQAPKRIELVVVDENGEVTGVEELPLTEDENAVWPADVYDLNGRLVKAQAKNLEDLPKGVYVVNGQKWVK